jgi:hypothetical protein
MTDDECCALHTECLFTISTDTTNPTAGKTVPAPQVSWFAIDILLAGSRAKNASFVGD